MTQDWKNGNQVVHTGRPEWGSGEVVSAVSEVRQGQKSQRLTVRFENAGIKKLSTAFAQLKAAAEMSHLDNHVRERSGGLATDLEAVAVKEVMTRLPDEVTDPFSSLEARFTATLELYRFLPSGGSLFEWACQQSGLKDPLTRFNRHELEQFFDRFRFELDSHLKSLTPEVRKANPAVFEKLASGAPVDARAALRQIAPGR